MQLAGQHTQGHAGLHAAHCSLLAGSAPRCARQPPLPACLPGAEPAREERMGVNSVEPWMRNAPRAAVVICTAARGQHAGTVAIGRRDSPTASAAQMRAGHWSDLCSLPTCPASWRCPAAGVEHKLLRWRCSGWRARAPTGRQSGSATPHCCTPCRGQQGRGRRMPVGKHTRQAAGTWVGGGSTPGWGLS